MKPYQKIVIISEIFPEYGLAETSVYLRRVEKINDEEVLNIGHLYDTIQTLKKKGKKKGKKKCCCSFPATFNFLWTSKRQTSWTVRSRKSMAFCI